MVVRQVSFDVAPESRGDFETFWKTEYLPAMARQSGFVAARLLKSCAVANIYQMELEFESEEASASWRANSDHESLKPKFKRFVPNSALTGTSFVDAPNNESHARFPHPQAPLVKQLAIRLSRQKSAAKSLVIPTGEGRFGSRWRDFHAKEAPNKPPQI